MVTIMQTNVKVISKNEVFESKQVLAHIVNEDDILTHYVCQSRVVSVCTANGQ